MTTKRGTKATKKGIKTLRAKGTTTKQAKAVKGGFEIKDFSFGVENPTTIGSATGGAGAGRIK